MKNLLVIRNDKIGDFMLAWPAFAMLKQSAPQIVLIALVPAYTADLARLCPYLDGFIIDDKTDAVLAEVKSRRFDGVISFVSDVYNAKLVWKAKIPYRLAPATKLIQFLYNHRLTQRRSQSAKPEFEYNLDLARAFLTAQGLPVVEPERPFLAFEQSAVRNQKKKLTTQLGLDADKKWAFIHSSTGGSANNLSLPQYAELIKGILAEFDCRIVLTAAPDESEKARELSAQVDDDRVVIYDKNDGLPDFALAVACADLFIAGSTGPLHIAGALNVPTVGFYPSRRSALPLRWQPLNDPQKHIAFMPPKGKQTEKNLTLISIADSLKAILPFIRRVWG